MRRTKTLGPELGLALTMMCGFGVPAAPAQISDSPLYLEDPLVFLLGPIRVPIEVRAMATLDAGGVSARQDIVISDGATMGFLDLDSLVSGVSPLPVPPSEVRAMTAYHLFDSPSGRPQLLAAGDQSLFLLSLDFLHLGWLPLLDVQVHGLASIDLGGVSTREELVVMLPDAQSWAFDADAGTWTELPVPPAFFEGLFAKELASPALNGAVVPTLFGVTNGRSFVLDDVSNPVPAWIGPFSRPFSVVASTPLPDLPISVIAPVPVATTEIEFSNVTALSGIAPHAALGNYHSSGALFSDLTGDGYPDLYLAQWNQPNFLYVNGGDGIFSMVMDGTGASDMGPGTGAVAADYDNDGDRDLFVINHGARSTLYQNQGGAFVDVTETTDPTPADPVDDLQEGVGVGIDTDGAVLDNSLAAAWSDIDRDGLVDLFVGNHCVMCAEGERDVLYRNNGDGTFTDITVAAGIETADAGRTDASTQAVGIADLNLDGWPDIYVAQRQIGPTRDRLFLNDGDGGDGIWDGTFTEYFSSQPDPLLGNHSPTAQGVDFGDYDNDGDLDVFVADAEQLDLYRNLTIENGGQFALSLTADPFPMYSFGWGAGWLDADNDGDRDLHVATSGGLMDHLFRNDTSDPAGTPAFTDVALGAELGEAWDSRGSVYADYDLDGWVDTFIVNREGIASALHRNLTGESLANQWVEISLQGDPSLGGTPFRSSRDAIGARVEVLADIDGDGIPDRQTQELRAGGHALGSMSSSTLHFGLGEGVPLSITVHWPSGRVQQLTSTPVNQRVLVVEADTHVEGWTEFVPSADTRTVYVSPTGLDTNDGLTPNAALRTIPAGMAQLRDGFPDWLLLERGGTWNDWIFLDKSGRSAAEKMLISSYGTGPRPRLETPIGESGVANYQGGVEHVAVVGLELTATGYDGSNGTPSGVFLLGWFNDLLFEDLYIHNYSGGLVIQNQVVDPAQYITDIQVRRSVIERIYTTGSNHSQGLYGEGLDTLLIEECVFFRCGFDEDVPGSEPTIFRHSCYLQVQSRNVTARRNITLETSSHGFQFRGSNTVAEDNFLARVAIGFLLGGGDDPALTPDGGGSGVLQDNVVYYGRDIDAGTPRGFAFSSSNLLSGLVRGNLFAQTDLPHELAIPFAFGRSSVTGDIGINNLTIEDNVVYNWRGHSISGDDFGAGGTYTNVVFRNNQIQTTLPQGDSPWLLSMDASHAPAWSSAGNRFFHVNDPAEAFRIGSTTYDLEGWKAQIGDASSVAEQVAYPDPGRTPELYVDHVEGLPPGTSTFQDFVGKVLGQSRDSWNPSYGAAALNAWLRAGFGR